MSSSSSRPGPQNAEVGAAVTTTESSRADTTHPKPDVADTGLTIVYTPEHSQPVLDIVFIHGLRGHPFRTWAGVSNSSHMGQGRLPQRSDSMDADKVSTKLKGFFTLKSSETVSNASVIAQGASHIFWPRDFLPVQCPNARVLVFGYNTAIAKHPFAGAVNKNSIFAHSKALVNDLSRTRPLARPVQFVTHSLGGIVLKEALAICSTSNCEEFKDILTSTAGIVFLGTPHRGSSVAGVGEIARKVASVMLMDTNPRILDSLSLKNSDLERCQDTFSSLWQRYKFQVKTFQEGLPLRLPTRLGQSKMSKVVPDISSCIGDSRERAETLDGDHRSICRYTNIGDPNFEKVAAELQTVYSNISSKSQVVKSGNADPPPGSFIMTHEDQEKLEILRFREMLVRQLAIGAPADNTCQWLPGTTAFKKWTERSDVDVHSGLLQIIGKPGSGKSTLIKSLFETTRSLSRSKSSPCVVGHFFNRRGQDLEHCARGMFRSILYQLGSLHPIILKTFEKYKPSDLQFLESVAPLSYVNFLKSALSQVLLSRVRAPERTIIFLDALDECDRREAADIGYYFTDLTKAAHRAGIKLDVCIARREYPLITFRNCLEVRMETFNVQDIQLYIHQKLELVGMVTQNIKTLQETIVQRSNGIFLWVVLVVESILKDLEKGKNTKHILSRTKSLPSTLEDLFAEILEEMDPNDLKTALRLFQWAVLATDRLRVREWHHILGFLRERTPSSLKELKESEYYTETDTQLERQIRSLSQGLVEVKDEVNMIQATGDVESLLAGAGSLDSTTGDSRIVQLIHETVADFFIGKRANRLFNQDPDYDFVGEGHLSIMSTCLDYIRISELDQLAAARRHRVYDDNLGLWSAETLEDRGRSKVMRQLSLRHRPSATSFMSSASHHSAQYPHRQDWAARFPESSSTEDLAYLNDIDHMGDMNDDSDDDSDDAEVDKSFMERVPFLSAHDHRGATTSATVLNPMRSVKLFPFLRLLPTRHDRPASDASMTLRVDTLATERSRETVQRFYLRLYDLPKREFFLHRNLASDVLNSNLTYYEPENHQVAKRSRTALRGKSTSLLVDQELPKPFPRASFNNQSSKLALDSASEKRWIRRSQLVNGTRIEFSNYARVDVNCRSSNEILYHYFEYWGVSYKWKQVLKKEAELRSFHLFANNERNPVAHICPDPESAEDASADEESEIWIQPCSLWISDLEVVDKTVGLADVIMSTGLIALVGNDIKERFAAQREPPNQKPPRTNLHDPSIFEDPNQDPAGPTQGLFRLLDTAHITLHNYATAGTDYPRVEDERSPKAHSDGDIDGDDTSISGSARTQILEEYPALASYAINRAFVHARAGFAMGANPNEVLEKLVLHDQWSRWYFLQEGVTGLKTWQDILTSQDLSPWVIQAFEMIHLARINKPHFKKNRRKERLHIEKRTSGPARVIND